MTEKRNPDTRSALVSLSQAIESVASNVSQSIVGIHSRNRGNGSAVVWTTNGHIVTCSHLVRKVDEVKVGLSNGKSFPAKVIGNDPYSDIALLKIKDSKGISLNPVEVADSENLKAGQF